MTAAIILNGRFYRVPSENFSLSLVLLLSKFCHRQTRTLLWNHLWLPSRHMLKVEKLILDLRRFQVIRMQAIGFMVSAECYCESKVLFRELSVDCLRVATRC